VAVEFSLVPNNVVLTGAPSQFGAGVGVGFTVIPNVVVLTGLASRFGAGLYSMKAYNTVLLQFVFWFAADFPDFVGTQSGYPPGDLSAIALIGVLG
jgi:hypothetical protein